MKNNPYTQTKNGHQLDQVLNGTSIIVNANSSVKGAVQSVVILKQIYKKKRKQILLYTC